MIADEIVLFIVGIVLIYIFEHKIIPTLGVFVLTLIEIYKIVVINITSITETKALYIFLYAIVLVYASYMMLIAPQDTLIESEHK